MKKIDVRIKKTNRQLFNALMELLSEKKFEDISIIEICEKAEVHRATFYKHFTDKYDFLNSCFQMKFDEIKFAKQPSDFTVSSIRESCLKMIRMVFRFVDENIVFFRKIKENSYSSAFESMLTSAVSDFLCESLQSRKNLVSIYGIELEIISSYYGGAIVGVVKWWIDNYERCSLERIFLFAEKKVGSICMDLSEVIQ